MTEREKAIQLLISDCLLAHQEIIIVKLIAELEKDYEEVGSSSQSGVSDFVEETEY